MEIGGGRYIPQKIQEEARPSNIGLGTWARNKAEAIAETEKQFGKLSKNGGFLVKGAIGVDILYSAIDDAHNTDVPAGKVMTNMVVNAGFDYAGLEASTIVGSYGGPWGAVAGFIFGLVYIGATQVWTPGGKSLQDRAKDAVYDNISDPQVSEPRISQGMWNEDPSWPSQMR